MTESDGTRQRATRWLFALTALLLLAGRWWWLAHYAVSVPFWDQWDAEGWNLIRPWVRGELRWTDLLAAHNEHRIAWARLAMLGLYVANGGQWDNLVEVYFNAPFFVATLVLLGLIATRSRPGLSPFWVWPTLLMVGALPIAWENFLVGLQLPFDLMVLATIAGVWICSGSWNWRAALLVVIATVFSFGTLASGVLIVPALAYVLLLRVRQHAIPTTALICGMAVLLVLGAMGLSLVHHVDGHEAMRAKGLADFLHAFGLCAGWPTNIGWPGAFAVWLPWLWLQHRLWVRPQQRGDLFFSGMGAWALLQCVAIAYSRGHDLAWLSSRYTAVTLIQAMVALYAAARMLQETGTPFLQRLSHRFVAGVSLVAVICGLAMQCIAGYYGMDGRHSATQIETQVVRDYLANADGAVLRNRPALHIPYPDPQRLQQMLDDPALRTSLLPSISIPPSGEVETVTPKMEAEIHPIGPLSAITQLMRLHADTLLLLAATAWILACIRMLLQRIHPPVQSNARNRDPESGEQDS